MDWLSLFLVALICAIAYIQTLQGLYSATIMCVLVLICSVLAFAMYEHVALSYLLGPLGDLSIPVAFAGLFVVPLIGSRLALDSLLPRSSLLPVLIDRAAAACVGTLTAMTLAGMLAVAIQMTPLGGAFMGHTLIDEQTGEEGSLWLSPDRFAVTFATMMSDGLFSGDRSLSDAHPDLAQEIRWSQSSPNEIRHVVPENSVTLVQVDDAYPDYIFDKTGGTPARGRTPAAEAKYERKSPPSGHQWLLVRLKLGPTASDEKQRHRFTRRQIRLVGRETTGGPAANYAPVAMNDDDDPAVAVPIKDGKLYAPLDTMEVAFVFDVSDRFVPEFIEYMIGARIDLSDYPADAPSGGAALIAETADTRTTASTASRRSDSTRSDDRRRGDRVSGVRTTSNSHFGDDLPTVMTDYQKAGVEHAREALTSGHIYGKVADQGTGGSNPRIAKFDVPSEQRLFHLEVRQLRARSGFGRALSQAVTTASNYLLEDDTGKKYPVVGQYAVANVGGDEFVEIQYFPEDVAVSNRGGIREFRRIKKRELDAADSRLVYLFLVDPGAGIKSFSTGRRSADLSDLDLIAPR